MKKFISEADSFVSRSIHISKIVQGTHHQEDICYATTAGIQCLCISLIAVCWSLIQSISRRDSNDFDWILRKDDEFKSLNKFKLLGVEDLPTEIEIHSHSIDVALLENNRTGEITSSTYLNSIGDIVGNCSHLGNVALLCWSMLYYVGLKYETLYFRIQFINLLQFINQFINMFIGRNESHQVQGGIREALKIFKNKNVP